MCHVWHIILHFIYTVYKSLLLSVEFVISLKTRPIYLLDSSGLPVPSENLLYFVPRSYVRFLQCTYFATYRLTFTLQY